MPLARIQRTFSSLPLTNVSIRDTLGQPARIYADALGRLPVDNLGTTRTSPTGLLDIYVDDSKTYNLEFSVNGVVLERVNGVDPQGIVEIQNPVPGVGGGISAARTLAVFDTPTGGGLLNGKTTSSGSLWFVTGTGIGTTSVNPAGYIEGTSNTYCYVQAPARVQRVEQIFSGPLCTIAIAGNNDLQSLIHQNFSSGGSAALTIFVAGVSTVPAWGKTLATIPNINDNLPHTCVLEMQGALAFAYVDEVLVAVSADARLLTAGGNWAYAQIHSAAGDRIYGFSVFTEGATRTDDSETKIDVAQLRATSVAARTLTVGNPSAVGWLPNGTSYFHTDDNQGHTFASSVETVLTVLSTEGGNRARIAIVADTTNTVLGLRSNADGTADIQHQGTNRIVFPFNVARVDQSVPQRLPAYTVATLPSAATYVGCLIRVTDGSSNQQIAISDNAAWRFAGGAAVS